MAAHRFTPEEFVQAWQNANGVKPVADALGLSVKHASAYAANLRKKGVPLKRLRATRIDYDALRKLATELLDSAVR